MTRAPRTPMETLTPDLLRLTLPSGPSLKLFRIRNPIDQSRIRSSQAGWQWALEATAAGVAASAPSACARQIVVLLAQSTSSRPNAAHKQLDARSRSRPAESGVVKWPKLPPRRHRHRLLHDPAGLAATRLKPSDDQGAGSRRLRRDHQIAGQIHVTDKIDRPSFADQECRPENLSSVFLAEGGVGSCALTSNGLNFEIEGAHACFRVAVKCAGLYRSCYGIEH